MHVVLFVVKSKAYSTVHGLKFETFIFEILVQAYSTSARTCCNAPYIRRTHPTCSSTVDTQTTGKKVVITNLRSKLSLFNLEPNIWFDTRSEIFCLNISLEKKELEPLLMYQFYVKATVSMLQCGISL